MLSVQHLSTYIPQVTGQKHLGTIKTHSTRDTIVEGAGKEPGGSDLGAGNKRTSGRRDPQAPLEQ